MGGGGREYVRYLFCTGGISYVLAYLTRKRLDFEAGNICYKGFGRGRP
jgi:hypothetical protein